jgi:hypothetical protein
MGRSLRLAHAKQISTEDKTDGDSTENKTGNTPENTENGISVSEEKAVAV